MQTRLKQFDLFNAEGYLLELWNKRNQNYKWETNAKLNKFIRSILEHMKIDH